MPFGKEEIPLFLPLSYELNSTTVIFHKDGFGIK